MFDWATMEYRLMEALNPKTDSGFSARTGGPVGLSSDASGGLRHRVAAGLVRLAVVLDPTAQAAFASNRLVGERH
jgi:hypothetical protein